MVIQQTSRQAALKDEGNYREQGSLRETSKTRSTTRRRYARVQETRESSRVVPEGLWRGLLQSWTEVKLLYLTYSAVQLHISHHSGDAVWATGSGHETPPSCKPIIRLHSKAGVTITRQKRRDRRLRGRYCVQHAQSFSRSNNLWGRGGVVDMILDARQGVQGSIPGGVAPGSSLVGIAPLVGEFHRGSPASLALTFQRGPDRPSYEVKRRGQRRNEDAESAKLGNVEALWLARLYIRPRRIASSCVNRAGSRNAPITARKTLSHVRGQFLTANHWRPSFRENQAPTSSARGEGGGVVELPARPAPKGKGLTRRMSADGTPPSLDVLLAQCHDDKDLVRRVSSRNTWRLAEFVYKSSSLRSTSSPLCLCYRNQASMPVAARNTTLML
ncbi:hypothetical protein PR048_028500 [Dryococelus australis]|uniref:Uncharacterized protein n=1 Tax=Dryococelus australis TaxID=614101 RepID=A0ABQ9GAR9_9NEOP|nr:hypothetical protein PR048_028500 [Dryococelus australis]